MPRTLGLLHKRAFRLSRILDRVHDHSFRLSQTRVWFLHLAFRLSQTIDRHHDLSFRLSETLTLKTVSAQNPHETITFQVEVVPIARILCKTQCFRRFRALNLCI